MKKLFLLLLLFAFSCNSGQDSESAIDNFEFSTFNILLNDTTNLFSKNLTKNNLIEKIGKFNIVDSKEWIEEGTIQINISKIYPNTDKELTIYWTDDNKLKSIQLNNPNSKWSFNNLMVGMTLDEIEKINSTNFNFYGFGWDEGGKIFDWNNGKFSDFQNGLIVYLLLNFDELTESDIEKLSGDGITLNSNDIILKKEKVIIDKIEVMF